MITLEDQIRRYAVDVAGPAMAEPPADLDQVGHPRHRGRWVLVAALVVFIAGLTWVATRPTELGDRPSADTVPSEVGGRADSYQIRSADPCGPTGRSGARFDGPAGQGICIVPVDGWEIRPGDTGTYLEVVSEGQVVTALDFRECALVTWTEASTGLGDDGSVIFVAFAEAPAERIQFEEIDGSKVTAELVQLPAVDGLRVGVARLRTGYAGAMYFDGSGNRVEDDPSTGTSIANCGVAAAQ
jgi:hypothetical protein